MDNTSALSLSKPCIDIGYFTANADAVLAFWREEMGLSCEPPVAFNQGLTQYRHALGDSVIKVNTAPHRLSDEPSAYRELMISNDRVHAPETFHDPDGNPITLVPPGFRGITGLGLKIAVNDIQAHARFLATAMGFRVHDETTLSCGNSRIFLEQNHQNAAHDSWVSLGLTYFTVHVMRVDAAFEQMVSAGATSGEAPYSIERIARISFVRDLDGNWIEVAQRAALAGPWWD